MGNGSVWHEQDEFWRTFQQIMFPPESFDEAQSQVEQLIDMLEFKPPARVLDMPCGVGRHAIPLAEKGFEVTAVDQTEYYLETARERAENAQRNIK